MLCFSGHDPVLCFSGHDHSLCTSHSVLLLAALLTSSLPMDHCHKQCKPLVQARRCAIQQEGGVRGRPSVRRMGPGPEARRWAGTLVGRLVRLAASHVFALPKVQFSVMHSPPIPCECLSITRLGSGRQR